MSRNGSFRVKAALALSFLLTAAAHAARPNIIVIVADDMGFSDIGSYGGEIRTPNIDRLATGGIRFTQFYNAARCCPTRAALLTGLYPHQAGIGHMMDDLGLRGYRGNLERNSRTIAEVLRSAGYRTYMSGKWHVTLHIQPEGPKFNWPLQRGFDRFFGTIHGVGSYYDPLSLTRGNTQIPPGEDFFYTDRITDNAARFLREHKQDHPAQPFFLYLAYTAPHWPMQADARDIAKYEGVYEKGWDAIRAERYKRMIEAGIVAASWPLAPRDREAPAWKGAALKPWQVRRMQVYAAMVDRMDQGIGRILRTLEATGQHENTLILFLSDNGGSSEEWGSEGPPWPDPAQPVKLRPLAPDQLQTRMQPDVTRDGRPVRFGRGVMPGPADTFVSYGLPWANASNSPFRRFKRWVHEGGIASPLILYWPAGIDESRRGKLYREPAHVIDLMPTVVELAGATYPAKVGDAEVLPMQGVSLRPAFANRPLGRREPLFWEHEGHRAVRMGEWKLVAAGAGGSWELYDLEADRTELRDLSSGQPERVRAMARRWQTWADEVGVELGIWGVPPRSSE